MRLAVGIVLYENAREQVAAVKRSVDLSRSRIGSTEISWRSHSPIEESWLHQLGPFASWDPTNPGFGAGHNALMKSAFDRGAEGYVCVNPDAFLHRACLEEMVKTAARPAAGLVEARLFPAEHPKPYDRATGETPWCAGTVLLVTRALYEKVGGFDERFFMYCEDVDLSWRARGAGFKLYTAQEALAFHYVEERALDRRREQAVHRSAMLLGQKYGGRAFVRTHRSAFLDEGGRRRDLPNGEECFLPAGIADFTHGLRFATSRW